MRLTVVYHFLIANKYHEMTKTTIELSLLFSIVCVAKA